MTLGVAVFVGSGILAAILLGIGVGFDVTAMVILALIVAVGLAAVSIASKFSTGEIEPAYCPACGGTLSPNAPYCKHCLEPIEP